MSNQQTLKEQKDEIYLLIDYGAPENSITAAKEIVAHYQADRIALNLLQEFYSYLPEAENDYIKRLQLLEDKDGIFLFLISTNLSKYLYTASMDSAVFLGKHGDGIWEKEVLAYFQLTRDAAKKRFKRVEIFADYTALDKGDKHCKICSAGIGETHRLGCPVEICPWCSNQLSTCNCRFTKLNTDKIKTEKELKLFKEKLTQKGRIPFELSQQPGGMLE